MWADVGSVTGAVAAVSVTLEKTKLGGLVRHQCVMATGTDLTWTQCHIDRGRICMENCFMNGENLLFLARLCLRKQMLHFFFSSWQHLAGIIHGTHPISHSACATHVFLFNLLVFSSSATTRTLPAIFFPARYKRITDVKGWNIYSRLPFPSSCAVTTLWQPLHSLSLSLSPSFPLYCFPEACPSLVRYVGTRSCTHLPPVPYSLLLTLFGS